MIYFSIEQIRQNMIGNKNMVREIIIKEIC